MVSAEPAMFFTDLHCDDSEAHVWGWRADIRLWWIFNLSNSGTGDLRKLNDTEDHTTTN